MRETYSDILEDVAYECEGYGIIDSRLVHHLWETSDLKVERENCDSWMGMRNFIGSSDRTAILWGTCGTGKTYAGQCCLVEAMSQRKYVTQVSAKVMHRALNQFDPGFMHKWWRGVSVLMIDDFDKPNWDTKTIGGLWEILDHRSTSATKKTIITMNTKADEGGLRQYLLGVADGDEGITESIIQRLHPALVLEFKGKSHR